MYRVTTEINFAYGHRLLNYNGKCAHPHGHNGRVEIELSSEILDAADMAIDFTDIKHTVQRWVDENIDHQMILRHDDPLLPVLQGMHEPVYVMEHNPTAESLARLICDVAVEHGYPVSCVRFWESPTSYATYLPVQAAPDGHAAATVETTASRSPNRK
ncbi:MAG: 6-pyruvoyltetrahydropterin/6-carboxytetrahydropterin synthase [Chloroflexota bacterium]|jgi:6-pyruvoyltetrahydropterin/6-carboxytetrahydropterin synthase|nr:6-pyruvoyltetrahydropterin/6-carboxytetrahydropterin synthase [Chloroflexota bacterium]